MTMEMTPRWALPLLFAGQAQKEIFHNEALIRIDMLLHGGVDSADVTTPPPTPVIGQCWIVAAGATGAWAGQADSVAGWSEGGWRFVAPETGLSLHVADRGHAMMYDGSAWDDAQVRPDGLYVDGARVTGARQPAITDPTGGATIDSEARSALSAVLARLRAHGLIDT